MAFRFYENWQLRIFFYLRLSKSMEPSSPRFEVMTTIRSDAILKFSPSNPNSRFMERPSQFYMITYHYDRILAAAIEFRWFRAAKSFASESGVARLESALKQHLLRAHGNTDYPCPLKVKCHVSLFPDTILIELHKIRVLLDYHGNLNITSAPTPPSSLRTLFPSAFSRLLPTPDQRPWRIFVYPHSITPSQYTAHKTTNRTIYEDAQDALLSVDVWTPRSEVLLVNTENNVMEGSITTPYFYRRGRWVTPPATDGGNVGTTRRWALEKGLCIEETVPVSSLEPGECIWLSNGVRGWGWGPLEASVLLEPSKLPGVATIAS